MKIRFKDIQNFIEGNLRYFQNKFFSSPDYINEQVYYRLSLCKDDCLKNNKCNYCPCPPRKKVWVIESCNDGNRFPNLMDKEAWEEFKQKNNIKIDDKRRL